MRLAAGLALAGTGGLAALALAGPAGAHPANSAAPRWIDDPLPPRAEQLRRLAAGTAANPFDVLVIGGAGRAVGGLGLLAASAASRSRGAPLAAARRRFPPHRHSPRLPVCRAPATSAGGATGTGCAVDAATRCVRRRGRVAAGAEDA